MTLLYTKSQSQFHSHNKPQSFLNVPVELFRFSHLTYRKTQLCGKVKFMALRRTAVLNFHFPHLGTVKNKSTCVYGCVLKTVLISLQTQGWKKIMTTSENFI